MSYDIADIRVQVLHKLHEIGYGNRDFLVVGVLDGLRVQQRFMREFGITFYDEQVGEFISSRHDRPLVVILQEYNAKHKARLEFKTFVGDAQHRSLKDSNEHYYAGLNMGMSYVAGLYHAFHYPGSEKADTISLALKYLDQVMEWVLEMHHLQTHLHRS